MINRKTKRLTSDGYRSGRPGAEILIAAFLLSPSLLAQNAPAAASGGDVQQTYAKLCSGCHGDDARGTQQGPGLAGNPWVRRQSPQSLRNVIRNGISAAGMPAFDLPAGTVDALVTMIISLNASAAKSSVAVMGPRANSSSSERDNARPAIWCMARARQSAPIFRMWRWR